jgi:virulence-associated protein VapD
MQYSFNRVQGSLYISASEDLANLFAAITALKTLAWLPASVRDIRAFRVEQWQTSQTLLKNLSFASWIERSATLL